MTRRARGVKRQGPSGVLTHFAGETMQFLIAELNRFPLDQHMLLSNSQKLRVFLSYARSDGNKFATSLFSALEASGFDPFLDQHDIVPGEPWKDRLTGLLREADSIVYVVTAGAVRSEHCIWEVDLAKQLGKRLIPVIAEEVPLKDMPAELQRLNFVFFTREKSFGEALLQLTGALRTDQEWVREQTRISDAAERWEKREKSEDLLWRSDELAIAKAWLAEWTPMKPEVTALQRAFIQASDEAELRRISAERQQLEKMVAAQSARERATRLAFGFAVVLILATAAFGVWVYNLNLEARNLEAKAEQLEFENGVLQDSLEAQQDDLADRKREFAEFVESADAPATPTNDPSSDETSGASPDSPSATQPDRGAGLPALDTGVLDRIVEARWNVDIFWCSGSGGDANRGRAETIETALNDEKLLQASGNRAASPLQIGRVRLRELSQAANSKRGYGIKDDIMRPEPGEVREAGELIRILQKSGAAVPAIGNSTTPTAQYLSVFICKSSA